MRSVIVLTALPLLFFADCTLQRKRPQTTQLPARNDDGRPASRSRTSGSSIAPRPPPAPEPPPPREPIRVEVLDPSETPPNFVLRGTPRGDGLLVFLHGMCGHGLGYAQSFQFTAAQRGTLIAPQADIPCGDGPWAKWSGDVAVLDARIQDVFRRLGFADPIRDVVVIGYSQGATRAEALARKYPNRYTRLISIGAPRQPRPWGLTHLKSAVMMAGERDRQDLMKRGARSMKAAGIPTIYIMIPEARHGGMGPEPERTMAQALGFLFEQARGTSDAGARSR